MRSLLILLATAALADEPVIVRGPVAERADAVLRSATARGFAGVALVAEKGQVILQKGYGLADRKANTPMTPDTIVQIGSNTKDFTIVAILQLREKGLLSLDDPITKYFADVPEDKRSITVNDLLTHRAGLPQNLGPDFDAIGRDEEIRKALAAPLLFKPHEGNSYSNVGYSLLAAIIEKVSGKPYDIYVRDAITDPLGLAQTGYLLPKFDRKRVAHGYRGDDDTGTMLDRPHATDGHWWNLRGNGGMLSTLPEMYRFYSALFGSEKLMKAQTRNIRFRPSEATVLAGSNGIFFFLYNRLPAAGYDIMLVANSTAVRVPELRDEVERALELPGSTQTSATKAPFQWPDTPAARAARSFLEMYNTGDGEKARVHIHDMMAKNPDDTRTLDERVASYKSLYAKFGTLTPVAVLSSVQKELRMTLRSDRGGMADFIFATEDAEPFRLRSVGVAMRD